MFTGIVEEVGRVAELSQYRLAVKAQTVTGDVKLGDSISVNGACLTVVEFDSGSFAVDLAPENVTPHFAGSSGCGRRGEPGAGVAGVGPHGRSHRSGACGRDWDGIRIYSGSGLLHHGN